MFSEIRISRLQQPRATLFAIVLLVVVFLLFGAFASAVEPLHTPQANTLEGPAMLLDQWVFGS